MMRYLLIILALVIANQSKAQNAGGMTSGSNVLQVTWSVGEVVVTNYQNSSLILSQGVIQPHGVPFASSDANARKLDVVFDELFSHETEGVVLYPNPVIRQLMIKWPFKEQEAMPKIILADMYGKSKKALIVEITDQSLTIDCSTLVSGVYSVYLDFGDRMLKETFIKK